MNKERCTHNILSTMIIDMIGIVTDNRKSHRICKVIVNPTTNLRIINGVMPKLIDNSIEIMAIIIQGQKNLQKKMVFRSNTRKAHSKVNFTKFLSGEDGNYIGWLV